MRSGLSRAPAARAHGFNVAKLRTAFSRKHLRGPPDSWTISRGVALRGPSDLGGPGAAVAYAGLSGRALPDDAPAPWLPE